MHPPTSDLRIRAQKPLIAPAVLEDELPLSDAGAELVTRTRRDAATILTGGDARLLVVVGPCSIHDPAAAFEYAERLRDAAALYRDELLLVMRVYFEKPRTVFGWKGLINDPFLDDSFQINAGLRMARKLMVQIVAAGVPVATEFLDTTLGQYYADLVTWGAIGARTVESQIHRELASGLSMPVGFKNRPDGDVQVAVDAIRAARHPHWFPSLTREGAPAIMGTAGNEHAHLVLRGGSRGTNFSGESIRTVTDLLRKTALPPYLMVDFSHGNSGKDPTRQPVVAADIAGQISGGERAIAAVMIESNLLGGSQEYRAKPLVYGRSITDACLVWEQTLPVLALLAGAMRARRKK
ncbi:MAG: 3-deoxy-7-phosphoheptulonate synthase [Opitutaceae bacterium]|nr:3-deoxy-7-phosphoheptulonate synthase [Opitutaceae bacterium]